MEDSAPLAGNVRQIKAYNGDGGSVENTTITDYTILGPTAVRQRTGLADLGGPHGADGRDHEPRGTR